MPLIHPPGQAVLLLGAASLEHCEKSMTGDGASGCGALLAGNGGLDAPVGELDAANSPIGSVTRIATVTDTIPQSLLETIRFLPSGLPLVRCDSLCFMSYLSFSLLIILP